MTDRQTMTGFLLGGALLLLLFVLTLFLDGNSRDVLLEEDGLVESATALGYFLCIAFMIYKGKLAYLKRYHDLFLLIVFFMLRELDFDKKFTTIGLLKIQFFISNRVPLLEKTVGAIIVLLLVYVVFSIIRRYSKEFWFGLKNHSIVSFGALIVVILLVVSKSLDGISRKLIEFGVDIGDRASMHASAVEEILELGIPIILLLLPSLPILDGSKSNKALGLMRTIALLLLTILPTAAVAEVLDQVPSIAHVLLQSFLLSVMLFLLSWFRWWLVFLGLAVALLFIGGTVELWREGSMREVLLQEKGPIYFAAAAFANLCLVTASVLGALVGRRRQ